MDSFEKMVLSVIWTIPCLICVIIAAFFMDSFDSTILTVIWAIPCLICVIAAFFDDDTWETSPLAIMSLFPIANLIAAISIVAHYCGTLNNKKTKAKETIEDKYDKLTKEAYNA